MLKAEHYFQQAVDSDPTYAAAYSGLADCNSDLAWHGFKSPADALPKAYAAARKAVEIDPQSAEAHASLGRISSSASGNMTKSSLMRHAPQVLRQCVRSVFDGACRTDPAEVFAAEFGANGALPGKCRGSSPWFWSGWSYRTRSCSRRELPLWLPRALAQRMTDCSPPRVLI
jgi:tetratricopeptide (TPR) repeat protein